MSSDFGNECALTSSARVLSLPSVKKLDWRQESLSLSCSISLSYYLCVSGDMRGFKYKKK